MTPNLRLDQHARYLTAYGKQVYDLRQFYDNRMKNDHFRDATNMIESRKEQKEDCEATRVLR